MSERIEELREEALDAVKAYFEEATKRVGGPESIPLMDERRLHTHFYRARRAFETLMGIT